jgi:hypothetical protein
VELQVCAPPQETLHPCVHPVTLHTGPAACRNREVRRTPARRALLPLMRIPLREDAAVRRIDRGHAVPMMTTLAERPTRGT